MKYLGQFILFVLAVAVLLGLQYQYWLGENGHSDHARLLSEIDKQQQRNDDQRAANQLLRADVQDLKSGLEAVEEHARLDLGLIKPGETFVQMSTAPSTHRQVSNSQTPQSIAEDAIEPIAEDFTAVQ